MLTEPLADELLRANLWYLRGDERDLLVDAGNGISVLQPVLADFTRSEPPREIARVGTHAHSDHLGGFHEFARRLLHPADVDEATRIGDESPALSATWVAKLGELLSDGGF